MIQFKTTPYAHQLTALERSKGYSGYAYLMEMGLGKSKVALDDTARLYRAGEIQGLLVIANRGSYMNWPSSEIPTHLPDDINRTVTYWDGRERAYGHGCIVGKPLEVLVMNVEALAFPRGYASAERFLKARPCIMVLDESTTIKTPSAKRTKAAIKLGEFAKYRRIMTGSPITKNPLDLYAQCEFLGRGLLGFTSYYAFRAHYADLFQMDTGGRSFKIVEGYKNLGELTKKLETFSYRVTKEDCLDLPPKVYQRYTVALTDEQKRLYRQLKEEAMAEITAADTVFAPLVITRLLRLHQVICGHLPTEDGKLLAIPSNRLGALLDVLGETSGKVVIWATYMADITAITDALTREYGRESWVDYHGGTDADARADAVKRFQGDSNWRDGLTFPKIEGLRFFVGNPKAGGYGITLHAASTMVYYSNNYDLEVRLQSEDRIHRIGQTKSCTYIDLVAPDTVDEKIINALRGKKQLAAEVLGDKWRGWL